MRNPLVAPFLVTTALAACIPMKGQVRSYSSPTVSVAGEPLQSGEEIAILGAARTDDNGIAKCVRDAVAAASPTTRIVPADKVRSTSGGALATASALLSEQEIQNALRETVASRAMSDIALRYAFTVEGSTGESNYRSSQGRGFPTAAVATDSSTKITDIRVSIWDAATGQKLGAIKTSAIGYNSLLIIFPVGFWTYAPTESAACGDMAKKILAYLAGDIRPAQ